MMNINTKKILNCLGIMVVSCMMVGDMQSPYRRSLHIEGLM